MSVDRFVFKAFTPCQQSAETTRIQGFDVAGSLWEQPNFHCGEAEKAGCIENPVVQVYCALVKKRLNPSKFIIIYNPSFAGRCIFGVW